MTYRPVLFSALFSGVLMLSACAPKVEQQGFNSELVEFNKVQVGVHTKEQVLQILGSPSTMSAFKDNKWYYVSKTVSSNAFLTPSTLEQKIVTISFNSAGVVSDIKVTTGEDAKAIKPVDRATKSAGYETGVLREVFGGFGRMGSQKPTR